MFIYGFQQTVQHIMFDTKLMVNAQICMVIIISINIATNWQESLFSKASQISKPVPLINQHWARLLLLISKKIFAQMDFLLGFQIS